MSRQTKQPNRVGKVENRLDRVERLLDDMATRQERTQEQLDQLSEDVKLTVGAVNLLASLKAPPGVNQSGGV